MGGDLDESLLKINLFVVVVFFFISHFLETIKLFHPRGRGIQVIVKDAYRQGWLRQSAAELKCK